MTVAKVGSAEDAEIAGKEGRELHQGQGPQVLCRLLPPGC